ncbi:2TM domain-containing protein [Jannaschia sp. R86511]|uniref:2TM domain-containing protein n=1 Tax=Jannaschia sp. R86511 TaxID=3093853 RepID=UPI0036D349AB
MPEPTSTTRVRPDPDRPLAPEAERTERTLRRAAVTRLENRTDLRTHLLTYVLVISMLIGIWAMSGGGFFWPFYPMAGWGVGLALHAYGVWSTAPTEAQVRAELQRMTR